MKHALLTSTTATGSDRIGRDGRPPPRERARSDVDPDAMTL